jgi:hypothetical protein
MVNNMFELKMLKSDLEDMLKKMSLPTGKEDFTFPVIAPMFTPDGGLEWVAITKNITVWIRARNLSIVGISEPTRIPFRVKDVLSTLNFFDKDDIISITHDVERGEDVFTTTENEKRKKTTRIPSVIIADVTGMKEAFPGKIGEDGVIILKNGRPSLHVECDSKIFKELVTNTNLVMGAKKKEEIPDTYHITFDGSNGRLETVAGDKNDRAHQSLVDEVYSPTVEGDGTVHYSMGFPDLMNALVGDIHVYCMINGPMWVAQHGTTLSVRYLIPPSNFGRE